jgi:hypothetical protein
VEPVRAGRDGGQLGRDAELKGLEHAPNIGISSQLRTAITVPPFKRNGVSRLGRPIMSEVLELKVKRSPEKDHYWKAEREIPARLFVRGREPWIEFRFDTNPDGKKKVAASSKQRSYRSTSRALPR